MKSTISKLVLIVLSIVCVFCFNSCKGKKDDKGTKDKLAEGYTLDEESGIYYKFYVENKNAVQPKVGDAVLGMYQISLKDSVIVPMRRLEEIVNEPLYKGDVNTALCMLHVGDSATFILDAETFFQYAQRSNPFGDKDLYFTFKLYEVMPKDTVKVRYQQYLEQGRAYEDSLMKSYVKENKIKVSPTKSGLYFIPKKSGKGKKAVAGQKVAVHYTGRFIDGTEFDSSIGKKPIEFVLGQGQMIPGWEEGIAMMKEGGKAVLLIPSKLAYGDAGRDPIPPFSPLVFEVELVKVGE